MYSPSVPHARNLFQIRFCGILRQMKQMEADSSVLSWVLLKPNQQLLSYALEHKKENLKDVLCIFTEVLILMILFPK